MPRNITSCGVIVLWVARSRYWLEAVGLTMKVAVRPPRRGRTALGLKPYGMCPIAARRGAQCRTAYLHYNKM
ncbi:MAG: hypothetical protein IJV22_00110 [Bacteroidales bacterium]|nr:hypothetical protein [Bacteroidales bacterium]